MTTAKLIVNNSSVLPGHVFDPYDLFAAVPDVVLTTEHAGSHYGLPVVVWRDVAYGPADLPGLELVAYHDTPTDVIDCGRLAGWAIRDYTGC